MLLFQPWKIESGKIKIKINLNCENKVVTDSIERRKAEVLLDPLVLGMDIKNLYDLVEKDNWSCGK